MKRPILATVAAAAAILLVAGGAPTAVAAPPPADPFPVDEPFAGAFVSDQWVIPNAANNATVLLPTALRLTSAATGGTGNATLAQTFSSDVAFSATFDYQAFGGGNPGDAFTFFLMNGAQAPNLGIGGGAAGYAGMQGAYIGVGFDNAGNFATDGQQPFPGGLSNSIVLRGAAYATGTGPQWPVLARTPATIQTDGVTPRTVTIDVEPSGTDSILLTVVVDGATVYDQVDVRTVAPAEDAGAGIPSRLQPARPATFVFGFSAGTGGATNNYDISNLVATAAADLSITKTGPATIEPGTSGTWTITASNDATNPVTGAAVTDTGLPAGMTDAAWTCTAVDGSCPAASGTGTGPWVIDLARNGTATFVVTGTVPDEAAGTTITNTATVAAPADRTEAALADNSASSETAVAEFPDLATTAALTSDAPLEFGQPATWAIDVANIGDGPAPASSVAITLPAAVDPTTVTVPAGCTLDAGVLTCALGDLPSGGSGAVTVTGTIGGSAATCVDGPATLSATASTTRRELVVDNNTDTVSTPCTVAVDLSVTKSSNGTVEIGSDVVWTIVAANAASVPAPATAISDALPATATWTCTVSDGSACSAASGTGSVDVTADLPPGGTATVVVTMPATAAGTLTNTASIAPCPACVDASDADDTATSTAEVVAGAAGGGGLPATGGTVPAALLVSGLALIGAGVLAFALRSTRRPKRA